MTPVYIPRDEFEAALLRYVVEHETARWQGAVCQVKAYLGDGRFLIRATNDLTERFNLYTLLDDLVVRDGTAWVEGELGGRGQPRVQWALEDGQSNVGYQAPLLQ